jgi:hypothetical protein
MTATIRRTPTGKWFVTISCEWEPTPLPPTKISVGIDVGLKTFATLSDGQEIANPRFFRQEEDALAKAQRKHRVALDTHETKRAEVTKQVKEAHAELDEQGVLPGKNAINAARWWPARMNAPDGSGTTLFTSTVAASSTSSR